MASRTKLLRTGNSNSLPLRYRKSRLESCSFLASWTGLSECTARRLTVSPGGRADGGPEDPAELALIGESQLGGNLRERPFRLVQQSACARNPELTDKRSDGASPMAAEGPGQMNGMHARFGRDLIERESIRKARPQQFVDTFQPDRFASAGAIGLPVSSGCFFFIEWQSLHRELCRGIREPVLRPEPQHERKNVVP